jgi:hypothetical protein
VTPDRAINPATGRCRGCGRKQVRLDTSGMGKLVAVPSPCRCRFWRQRNGVCRVCDLPVAGRRGVAAWCDQHRKAARANSRRKHLAKVGKDKHQRKYCERHRKEICERVKARYRDDAAVRQARNDYKRRWRAANRDKVRAQKERHALKHFRTNGDGARRWRQEVADGARVPHPAPRDERGNRLCLRCPSVVRGRARLCASCRASKEAG